MQPNLHRRSDMKTHVATTLGICFALFTVLTWARASSLPQGAHGSVILVPIKAAETVNKVVFEGRTQLIAGDFAVVAIPLFMEAGEREIDVSYQNGQSLSKRIKVLDRAYPEERITIADQEQVSPSATNLQRIRNEIARMREAYALFTTQPSELLPIVQPVEGRKSGVFGSRRYFNDQPRNPHSGIDLAAAEGTQIKSPAPGTVVVVGDFFFNGLTVMIDHGGGFVSMMCHMSEVTVAEGERIERGAIVGKVGSTGRSTGPHLHWTISLGGVNTDPEVFMRVLNVLYENP